MPKYSSLDGGYRMEERKLIKCRKTAKCCQYDNGDIEYIEGDDVEKWQALNSALVFHS